MLTDLRAWSAGEIAWQDVSRGILFCGPPGTGKTELARLVAKEAGFSLHASSLAQWCAEGSRSGDILKSMRAFFARAADTAPAVIFLDELDAIGDRMRRADHNSAWTDLIVGALLECLDGYQTNAGVVVIAATNHPHKIDSALRRPGRFDSVVMLERPSPALLPEVFRWHLGEDLRDVDLGPVALAAHNVTGAEVAACVRAARSNARMVQRAVEVSDLIAAVERIRPPLPMSQVRRIAVHEAGHAFVGQATGVAKPSAIAVLSEGGEVEYEWDIGAAGAEQISAVLAVALAGRATEALMLGRTGAGSGGGWDSDLARATRIAAAAHVSWGLGAEPIWLGSPEDVVEQVRKDRRLQEKIAAHLRQAETKARMILEQNRQILETVATAAMERRRLEGVDLDALLCGVIKVGEGTVGSVFDQDS